MPESAQKVIHELTAAGLLSSAEITRFDDEINVGVDALLERLVADNRITRYQADKFRDGQSSDIYFGDYIVLEELGRGGMGTVLLARHRRMEREVAIKVLPVTALDSEASVARFYQEVKVAAKLTHPNIVHAYDAGEHHGFHYLVMEYVKGHDLARVLEHMGPIPVSLALDYVYQTAKGLEYAHRKGIIHRDIKPSNLLLDDEGTVKILDMGLARLGKGIGGAEASMHLTTTGQVMGTVEYMSPEQAEDTRVADARSDIYSLGCTLYRLVTGIAPFARDTVVKTILAHREAPIPDFDSARNPELVPVVPLFQAMVAKNPDDRIQSATLLVQELDRLINDNSFPASETLSSDDVEVVSRGRSSSELPTQFHSNSANQEIQYTSDVVSKNINEPISYDQPTTAHQPLSSSSTPPQSSNPYVAPPAPIAGVMGQPVVLRGKAHRGVQLTFAGAIAIAMSFCFMGIPGLIIATITWICASNDLEEMKTGVRNPSGRTLTQTARILASVSGVIFAISVLARFF